MKKIRLNLDMLTVETFATTKDEGAERGTVRGHYEITGYGCDTVSEREQCICPREPNNSGWGSCFC